MRSSGTPARSRWWRTTTSTSIWCASRARRWGRSRCSSCPPASSTSRASRSSTARKRELAEEIGKGASEWEELKRFYTSPGFAEEKVIVYLATDLYDASAESDEEERLEVVAWPLAELDGAIEECRDAKSLIGLLLFRELRRT